MGAIILFKTCHMAKWCRSMYFSSHYIEIFNLFCNHQLNRQFLRDISKVIKQFEDKDAASKKSIAALESANCKLLEHKQNLQSELASVLAENERILSALNKRFSKPQVDRMLYDKNTHWTYEDYGSAIVLLGLGKKSYNYMRSHYDLPFPCVSSVKRYLSTIRFEPGMLEIVINLLEYVGQSMSELERQSALTFDEMHIHQTCCYDATRDQVYGPSRQVQVINIRGLFSEWKNPIFYEYDCPITDQLMDKILRALHSANFPVVLIDCDHGTSNDKFYKKSGVTLEKPYFLHPVTKEPVFCIHDCPHTCKLCKNHLIDKGLRLNPNSTPVKVATKEPLLELVVRHGREELVRHKMTLEHLTAQGSERQNVRKAVQVLSASTAKALLTAGQKGLLDSKNYEVSSNSNIVFNL